MLAIIQARCNSKRFKNKVLHTFLEKPIIQHVVDNVKRSKKISKVIVATSKNKTDNKLVTYLKKNNIKSFRGNHLNVAQRLCNAAKKEKFKYFIRISADSPMIKTSLINKIIKLHKKNIKKKLDLITNVFPKTFPKGQSVEILKTSCLQNNLKKFNKKDKEHVTRYFYKNYKLFSILNLKNRDTKKMFNMAIDTKQDLTLLLKKYFN